MSATTFKGGVHPAEYKDIQEKLNFSREELNNIYEDFTSPITEKLDELGVKYNMFGRIKSPFSIWKKMNKNNLTFDEVYDILAVRIVFDPSSPEKEQSECFDIYLALTKIYKSHPDRLRDWVTHPKANGYQALHVTLMSNTGQWVEVQIRSRRMNDIAEQGIAAHWKYKEGSTYEEDETELTHWLETIKEILEDPQPDSMDFLDTIKLNLYSSEIFIFTPKGELRTMPQGSTVLDFAFTIHTYMGTNCIGAKVNHKLEAINYELKSGDQVEILTSKSQKVSPEWLDFATTAKARGKIKQMLRKEERANQKFGEAIFHEFLENEDLEVDSAKMERICRLHGLNSRDELMIALGQKKIILGDAERNIIKGEADSWYKRFWSSFSSSSSKDKDKKAEDTSSGDIDVKRTLIINDVDMHKYTFADCCNPVPGDSVLGFVDDNGHFLYHRRLSPPEQLTWKSFLHGMLVCHQAFYARTDFAIATPYDQQYHYSADVDWCIRIMKAAAKENVPLLNLHMVVVNYTQEGQTTLHHRESLFERYRVMNRHYGYVRTFLMHCWFVVRSIVR